MEVMASKVYRAKQNYFYVLHKIIDEKLLISIVQSILRPLGFEYFGFESSEHIRNMLNDLPIPIINPVFYVSKDRNELFLVEFFYHSNSTVLVFYYYSLAEGSYYEQRINLLLTEIAEKYNLSYSYVDLNNSSDFQYEDVLGKKGIKIGLLKVLKEFKIDKGKIGLDRYFIDPKVISISSMVLKGNHSDILIEDLKYMDLLEKNNFLKIFVVFKCSSSGNSVFQLNRLDNLEIILESFRCPICGKKLIDEKREVNLTVSPFFEIYFTNYIWLKNVVFDYFGSIDGFKIYEYDKNVYITSYLNSLYLFVFTDSNNFLNSLSYYKDVEILNLAHSFFFVVNIENQTIRSSFVEKYKEKATVLNLNIESFEINNFTSILNNLKQKIEDLHNMTQFRNMLVSINYNNLFSYEYTREDIREDIQHTIGVEEKFLEEKALKEKVSEDEPLLEPFTADSNNIFESTKLEQEIHEIKPEPLTNPLTNVELDVLSKEEQRPDTEPYMEIVQTHSQGIEELSEYRPDIAEPTKSTTEEIQDKSIMEDVFTDLSKMMEIQELNPGLQKQEVIGNILEEMDLQSSMTKTQSFEEKESVDISPSENILLESDSLSVKESIEKVSNLDDLLKDVKVNFRSGLDNDISMKDVVSIFYHLLAGISKEKLAFIEKNVLYFRQTLGSKIPELKYYITIISPKGVNSFPRDEIFTMKQCNSIIERMNSNKNYYFGDKESYSFFVNSSSFFFSLFYNAAPNVIASSFLLDRVFDPLIIYSYPSDLKELKMEIIKRSIDNLNNLKLSKIIEDFVLLDENFNLVSEESFDSEILYRIYNYYSIYSIVDPIVWGWGIKDKGFYICMKFNNLLLSVYTMEFSLNQIVELYNSLYLLEVI